MPNTFATITALFVKMVGTDQTTTLNSLASTCIYDAENEIKKKLSKRYDFTASPFTSAATIPPLITTLAETLAVGYMYEAMARGSTEGFARADRYIQRVMENLDSIAAGETELLDTSGNPVDQIEGDWAVHTTENYPTTFNEDDPHNWSVSQDKLDDIEDEREE
jgi:hypothetical protein